MPKPTATRIETLLEPALSRLYRAAFRLTGNAADAEDLVQDTCIAACRNAAALARSEHPERWLLRVLYNRFVDGSRRRKRSPVVALDGARQSLPLASGEPGPEELADIADRERAFDCAWSKLEKTQRALLSLRAEGYGLAEIEEITGIARTVLRARLQRARQSLARHLEQHGEEALSPPRLRRSQ